MHHKPPGGVSLDALDDGLAVAARAVSGIPGLGSHKLILQALVCQAKGMLQGSFLACGPSDCRYSHLNEGSIAGTDR